MFTVTKTLIDNGVTIKTINFSPTQTFIIEIDLKKLVLIIYRLRDVKSKG